jgi:hypothetical protein
MMTPNTQIHITKDGLDIQTTMEAYKDYYKRIGWQFVDLPANLPGFAAPAVTQTQIAELTAHQGALL